MAEVIPQINIDGTKIKDTWTEKEYVTDEVYNALNKTVIDLKNNNNLLDSNSILFREEYNSSSKNLNNAIHQGVYSFTNSAVNAPSGVNGGNLLVTNTSKTNQGSSIITQIAFCHNGAVYARTKNTSENFTAWNKLAYITDNVASATNADTVDGKHATDLRIQTNFLASQGGSGHGYSFQNDGAFDTGMFSNSDGDLYFMRNGAKTSLTELAKLASPAFSGTPTAPTAGVTVNNTQIATTAFAQSLLKNKFTANTDYNGWSKNAITGIVRQWGAVTYNSSPNPQVITPPLSFSKLINCGATDIGWKTGTGNTYPNMEFSDGKLYIRPVYGNNEASLNGVVLRWWIECLL